ncbi:hypothetical protein [Salinisphaera sp. G21_0]|uniref:hypothetical protein n=1 Tax=Salinisphaera sp. G21_0 TaxID=2821094 RepID=UPI001ADA4B13|nr:hypothetical protein [Salinisphaera sp. G21_0]MBO9481105.1 hypothetical protein [Salinisphaera sp. G21_0]
MGPISCFSMFREVWKDKEGQYSSLYRDRKSSELFWRHGTGHQTFTTDLYCNSLLQDVTVDHPGCCLVSFDSGKRKIAPLNSGTRLLFRHQLPHESFLEPGKIKELSDRDIIVLHGFSELHYAQAFEHHLRVRSYYNEDGICILDKFPKWPSADQMASYGYVFAGIQSIGCATYLNMDSIWQPEVYSSYDMEDMKQWDGTHMTVEDIYTDSLEDAASESWRDGYLWRGGYYRRDKYCIEKQEYLPQLNDARRQPVLKQNYRNLQQKEWLMPVPAWRSVVQTEHSCLPELQLIMPADFDILPHCNPSGFGIAARTWPTGPAVSYDPSSTVPVFRPKGTSLLPHLRQPVKSYPSTYPFSQLRTLHVARSGADSHSATLKFAGTVLRRMILRR